MIISWLLWKHCCHIPAQGVCAFNLTGNAYLDLEGEELHKASGRKRQENIGATVVNGKRRTSTPTSCSNIHNVENNNDVCGNK